MNDRKVKHRIVEEYSSRVSGNEAHTVYELVTVPKQEDEDKKVQVVTIGPPNDHQETLSVLLLGETGAGKTRLVNALLNVAFGVHLADDFRFVLKDQMDVVSKSQIHSQTDYITAYLVYHWDGMAIDYNLIIIDTPGFQDTRSVEHQKNVSERVSSFLLNDFGIDQLHCIGLVAKANQNRISKVQVDILNEFSSVLSHDLTPITKLLATFASDDNYVHDVVKEAGIRFSSMYEFDNWPLYVIRNESNRRSSANLEFRWENMREEHIRFLKELSSVSPVSLKKTRQLQIERKLLAEATVKSLEEVKRTAAVVRTISRLKKELKSQLEEAQRTNWKYNERRVCVVKMDVKAGYHSHNCKICNKTCVNLCADPSNVVAGVVGTTTGIGTAFAAGLTSAVGSGVALGAEVGLLGGPVGAGLGSCIGLVSGMAAGLYAGIKNRKTKNECPLAKSDFMCEEGGCPHSFSEHDIEHFTLVESEEIIEKVDLPAKLKHDSIMEESKTTRSMIGKEEEAMHANKENLTVLAVTIVSHIRKICELGMNAVSTTPESVVNDMMEDMHDEDERKVLQMFLSAMKILGETPESDTVRRDMLPMI